MEKVLLLDFQEVLIVSMGRRICKEDNGFLTKGLLSIVQDQMLLTSYAGNRVERSRWM